MIAFQPRGLMTGLLLGAIPSITTLMHSTRLRVDALPGAGSAAAGCKLRCRGRVQVTFTDRVSGDEHRVEATYLLGCDGANSLVRTAIGACMEDLKFQQRWLVVDVATTAELNQWEGVHQVCDPHRAATYMRIGDTRYRWSFGSCRTRRPTTTTPWPRFTR